MRMAVLGVLSLLLTWPLAAGAVDAAAPGPVVGGPVPPALRDVPLIATITRGGADLYYLGTRFGLDGFLVMKDGKIQIFYLTPDRQGALFGALFSVDGANISMQQLATAAYQNEALKQLLQSAQQEQQQLTTAGQPAATPEPVAPAVQDGLVGAGVTLSPGERLYQDVLDAVGVQLGAPDAPLLQMMIDPHCQHCRATWRTLEPLVTAGKLRVKLVPIGLADGQSERHGAMLLAATDPLAAWMKFIAGDDAVLEGAPAPAQLAAIKANMALAATWKVAVTPYLVYRAKTGKVKIVQGQPNRVAAVLTDLGL